jgi:hypothetical protein
MILMTLKLKLKVNYKRNKHSKLRFILEKLKDTESAEMIQATVGRKFAALNFLEKPLTQ